MASLHFKADAKRENSDILMNQVPSTRAVAGSGSRQSSALLAIEYIEHNIRIGSNIIPDIGYIRGLQLALSLGWR